MILPTDVKKALGKAQHPFMIKSLKKLGIQGIFLNTIKVIYNKTRANIMLNGEQLKPFPLKLGMR
jgi:hypothetical protein